jgi:GTPase SAR1 family protein
MDADGEAICNSRVLRTTVNGRRLSVSFRVQSIAHAYHAYCYWQGPGDILLAVFDVTSRNSLEECMNMLQRHRSTHQVVALIANKVDLASRREVTRAEAEHQAARLSAMYYETSAKTGMNVCSMIFLLCVQALKGQLQSSAQQLDDDASTPARKSRNRGCVIS